MTRLAAPAIAAVLLSAGACGVIPCRDVVDHFTIDERFSDREQFAIEHAILWWAQVGPQFAILKRETGPVLAGMPGTFAMPTREIPESIRGRSLPSCALMLWPEGKSEEQVFRTAVHELGHFFGLPHSDSLMTADSADSTGCLSPAEAEALCKINDCDPAALGHRCQ